jgi:hypothetical protein
LKVGAQDCHPKASGAHTGDLSGPMLADAGASHVILGHSERRADHGETDALVRAKAEAAIAAGLVAIVCLGETEAQRDAGDTLHVIGAQLTRSVPPAATAAQLVIAYEPVWAIGRGRKGAVAVRWVRQTFECGRDLCFAPCRWRACGRGQPEGCRFRPDRRRSFCRLSGVPVANSRAAHARP